MAKKIYMTDTDVESVVSEIRTSLKNVKCYGSINIKRSFQTDKRVALLYFTPTAWAKMTTLVARYDTEVQWHGQVRRVSDFEFEIFDIIVPPHEVTGTTVVSDYKPYGEWLNGLDDETFSTVKFHGHSHVNMHVSPSETDTQYRHNLITQLPNPINGMDVFYIFLIINKRHEWSAEIYDFTNNALYSTPEIAIDTIFDDGNGLENFIAEAKKVAINRPVNYGAPYYGGDKLLASAASQPKTSGKSKSKRQAERSKNGDYDSMTEYWAAMHVAEDEEGSHSSEPGTDDENDPNSQFYSREWWWN